MSGRAAFSKRRGPLLAGLGIGTLLVTLIWATFGPDTPGQVSFQPDSYSVSAVGHEALTELLKKLNIPVERGRYRTEDRAKNASLLVVAEPLLENASDNERLGDYMWVNAPILLVLPKWSTYQNEDTPHHVGRVKPLHRDDIEAVLEAARVPGKIRIADSAECGGQFVGNLKLRNVQLLVDTTLAPIVSCGEGILVGELSNGDKWPQMVLSDPDVIATHGLQHGGAQLAVRLISHLRRDDRPVLFDEVLHGHARAPSVYREAFSFPLIFVTLQVMLFIAFVLWRTVGRFGAPEAPPGLGSGDRELLIENEVRLLDYSGDAVQSLSHYLAMTQREIRARLGAPRGQTGPERSAWLIDVASARGLGGRLDIIQRRVALLDKVAISTPRRIRARDILSTANAIATWKNEMIHGT